MSRNLLKEISDLTLKVLEIKKNYEEHTHEYRVLTNIEIALQTGIYDLNSDLIDKLNSLDNDSWSWIKFKK